MPTHTHADTAAIRALGHADTALADDLIAVAARVASVPVSPATFGPAGEDFLAALAERAAQLSAAITALAGRTAAAGHTAHASAEGYDDAERRAARLIGP